MKLLITGGAGYVGSACLRHMLRLGHDVTCVDTMIQGHASAIDAARLVNVDISNEAELSRVIAEFKPNAVMHFAASTSVGESVEDPALYYHNNLGGTKSLLNAMRTNGVRRLLFSSTCATYGMAQAETMNEETPLDPFSPYARTKLAVEWMIRDYADAYGIGFTVLRYFNAAGADPSGQHGEDHSPESHLIPLVLQVALGQRENIMIFGDDYPTPDGTCIRDYVHVDDLASAHQLAIEATTPETKEIYNVGTGRGVSVKEIVTACETVTGQKITQSITDRRPGDPPKLVANADKLKTRLKWQPRYTNIEDTIATAWEWHRTHPNGYSG